MKQQKLLSRILTATLSVLGFTSCDGIGGHEEMYGSPIVEFQVKGAVLSPDEKPLEGVQVIVRKEWSNHPMMADTVYTNAQGEFESLGHTATSVEKQKVYFNDVDGEANGGVFKSDSVELKAMNMEQLKKGDGAWYNGKFSYSVVQKLKKAEKEEKE